ncbi:2-oxoglutarate-dependent dioxygenase DAO-like [Malus sylvestris]|uniref:2-oxoglutarate-dependent dioxygenase DAO-like n=1 Tax=Malus sylvestris TaxID=3752 RepID=UPI0021AC985F|nr:2-oxoglutarate-dependent dioxygenase DAO-like [Malus sylvestris]
MLYITPITALTKITTHLVLNTYYSKSSLVLLKRRILFGCEAAMASSNSSSAEVIEKYAEATSEQVVDIGKKLAESLGVANTDFHKGWPCQFMTNKYNFSPASMGSLGLQEQTDSGFLTILQKDEDVGGLEVMNKSGAFVPVHPCPGTLFINLGDFA